MASWTTIQTELLDDFSAALSSGGNESPLIYLVEVFKNLLIFNGNPLVRILSSALVFAIVAIVLGVVTNNYSWVDKMWNIVPVYYGWLIVVNSPGSIHPRLLQMALFITFWGIRLTYNFYRKVRMERLGCLCFRFSGISECPLKMILIGMKINVFIYYLCLRKMLGLPCVMQTCV